MSLSTRGGSETVSVVKGWIRNGVCRQGVDQKLYVVKGWIRNCMSSRGGSETVSLSSRGGSETVFVSSRGGSGTVFVSSRGGSETGLVSSRGGSETVSVSSRGGSGTVFVSSGGGSETVFVSSGGGSETVSVVREWIRNSVCRQGVDQKQCPCPQRFAAFFIPTVGCRGYRNQGPSLLSLRIQSYQRFPLILSFTCLACYPDLCLFSVC